MKLGKRMMATIAIAGCLTVGSVTSPVAVDTASAAARPTRALCGTTNWDKKSPEKCNGVYRLYDLYGGGPRGTIIFQVNNTNYAANKKAMEKAITSGYKAANKWCGQNSLTCSIVTGVAVAILSPLFVSQS
jgi:hypothetical protein